MWGRKQTEKLVYEGGQKNNKNVPTSPKSGEKNVFTHMPHDTLHEMLASEVKDSTHEQT